MEYCYVAKKRLACCSPAPAATCAGPRTSSGVRPAMRPTMRLTPEELDAVFRDFVDDEPPPTEPRPELAAEWAAKMKTYSPVRKSKTGP